jgi:hypothetical protein
VWISQPSASMAKYHLEAANRSGCSDWVNLGTR